MVVDLEFLKKKARWVKKETLLIHRDAPETRLASSLSDIEIFTALYYGGILKCGPKDQGVSDNDRLIISKGHGAISAYPILADLGFFDRKELARVCKEGGILGGIPDTMIPGFETINGSLGHGLGVACGAALGLKRKDRPENVFVLSGDGELYEGSVWEAVMFAAEHRLDNLVLIVDNNKACMLDFCRNILDLEPLEEKFRVFKWHVERRDGHNLKTLCETLAALKTERAGRPKVLIADTVKGKGVPRLENDPMSHIRNLKPEEVADIIAGLE